MCCFLGIKVSSGGYRRGFFFFSYLPVSQVHPQCLRLQVSVKPEVFKSVGQVGIADSISFIHLLAAFDHMAEKGIGRTMAERYNICTEQRDCKAKRVT